MTDPACALADVRVGAAALRREGTPSEGSGGEGDGADAARVILDGVSLELPAGGTLALLGESGGGKSTLLRLLNRLVDPDDGQVSVSGRDVPDWSVAELRRHAALVPQSPPLLGGAVRDELSRPLGWAGRSADEEALRAALEVVQLGALPLDRPGDALSGGERGRLGLARALVLEPRLLVLDEPTGSLDVRTARELLANLRAWAEARDVALLVVTHRPEDLRALGGQGAVLLGGRLRGPWPAEALAAGEVDDPDVQAFLGGLEPDSAPDSADDSAEPTP